MIIFNFAPRQAQTPLKSRFYNKCNNAPIQIDWAMNIASNYFNQQQAASSFTTVSNVMVFLCELRH